MLSSKHSSLHTSSGYILSNTQKELIRDLVEDLVSKVSYSLHKHPENYKELITIFYLNSRDPKPMGWDKIFEILVKYAPSLSRPDCKNISANIERLFNCFLGQDKPILTASLDKRFNILKCDGTDAVANYIKSTTLELTKPMEVVNSLKVIR